MNDRVRTKLMDAIMVSKLVTGEEIVFLMRQSNPQTGLLIGYPYQVTQRAMQIEEEWVEVPVLESYCPWILARRAIFISWSDIVFSKEITPYHAELYLENLERTEPEEYEKLLGECEELIRKSDQAESTKAPADYKTRH